MKIKIRYYQSKDYLLLLPLLEKVYGSRINQSTLENTYMTDNRLILVAICDKTMLIGCAFIEVQEDFVRPRKILYVTYVAVDEEYRKHGVGRMLMNAVENACEEFDCTAIELTSADFRVDAHSFYKAIGFTRKKTTHFIKEVR